MTTLRKDWMERSGKSIKKQKDLKDQKKRNVDQLKWKVNFIHSDEYKLSQKIKNQQRLNEKLSKKVEGEKKRNQLLGNKTNKLMTGHLFLQTMNKKKSKEIKALKIQIKRNKKFNQKKSAIIRNLNKEVELLQRKLTRLEQEVEDLKKKKGKNLELVII